MLDYGSRKPAEQLKQKPDLANRKSTATEESDQEKLRSWTRNSSTKS
jgi:hypothetical protein